VSEYALRMRVESTFQDSKSRGWNLEASFVKDEARLDRLLLALFLAMWWVSHLAASCMHHGKRDRFDRTDRRDKGIFRLGRLWLLDILRRTRNQADLVHCFPFRKVATGWRFSLCSWRALPERFSPWPTIASRYRRWCQEGLWARILPILQAQEVSVTSSA
jgi:transposase